MVKKAVCLLSGGMDSATTAAIAKTRGFEIYALSFRYQQRHSAELDAAHRVAARLGIARHIVVDIDLRQFGGSALTGDFDVPKSGASDGIPVTYVPARNTVFLSIALAWAETLGAGDIFIGVNNLDYSGYPDCRPAYLEAFQAMANLATKAGVEGSPVRIHAPLLWAGKDVIVSVGRALGVNFSDTLSCYDPVGDRACGLCEACRIRAAGFVKAKVDDDTKYVPMGLSA